MERSVQPERPSTRAAFGMLNACQKTSLAKMAYAIVQQTVIGIRHCKIAVSIQFSFKIIISYKASLYFKINIWSRTEKWLFQRLCFIDNMPA
jgi:hypothetical protein